MFPNSSSYNYRTFHHFNQLIHSFAPQANSLVLSEKELVQVGVDEILKFRILIVFSFCFRYVLSNGILHKMMNSLPVVQPGNKGSKRVTGIVS